MKIVKFLKKGLYAEDKAYHPQIDVEDLEKIFEISDELYMRLEKAGYVELHRSEDEAAAAKAAEDEAAAAKAAEDEAAAAAQVLQDSLSNPKKSNKNKHKK